MIPARCAVPCPSSLLPRTNRPSRSHRQSFQRVPGGGAVAGSRSTSWKEASKSPSLSANAARYRPLLRQGVTQQIRSVKALERASPVTASSVHTRRPSMSTHTSCRVSAHQRGLSPSTFPQRATISGRITGRAPALLPVRAQTMSSCQPPDGIWWHRGLCGHSRTRQPIEHGRGQPQALRQVRGIH